MLDKLKRFAPFVIFGSMALGAAIALGVAFSLDGVQRWSLFVAVVLFGAGFVLDKYL